MRITVGYLITTFLISCFIYTLISNNLYNSHVLNRMRDDVDEIAHLVLHASPGDEAAESKQLVEIIEGILKKRLVGIWDDLYMMKKRLKITECSRGGGGDPKKTNSECSNNAAAEHYIERINYASEDLGALIESVEAEPVCGTNIIKSLFGLDYSANPPINMLRHSMEPGNCFAFKNDKAEVTVKLAKEIYIESIEVAHIPANLSPTADTKSAPKTFSVYGVDTANKNIENLLGSYVFQNLPTQCMQVFNTQMQTGKYHYVRFKFETNHGNPNYTCIYRIAVYGKL